MSRKLPARPNLEFLKNQAKALLRELQRQDPASRLADAQHAIAREYGFVNWAALKAHVQAVSPFTGTWIANLSKSTPHPDNPYRSATLRFEVTGDTITIADIVVDASGRETRGLNRLDADGAAHPSGQGYIVTARWLGSRVLDAVVTRDGRVEGGVRYEVSPDSRTLTLTSGAHRSVFERAPLPIEM
jgi:hypothetical protein